MVQQLFKSLFFTFIYSFPILPIAFISLYYFLPGYYGNYFDESVWGLVEWVIILNIALFLMSLPILILAIRKIWDKRVLRLAIYYYAPLLVVAAISFIEGKLLIKGDKMDFIESAIPNLGAPLIFLIIHAVSYFKIVKKWTIIT